MHVTSKIFRLKKLLAENLEGGERNWDPTFSGVGPRYHANSQAMQRRTLCRGHATLALAYAVSMEMRALVAALSIANGEANGGRFLMKLPAPHKPPGNIGGL